MRQHLAGCAWCQKSQSELIRISNTLDVIGQMAQIQRYPELPTAYLMKNARLGYSQRRFSGRRAAHFAYDGTRSPLRLVSLPVALLLVLFTLAMIALALVGYNKISHQISGPGSNLNTGTNAVGGGVVARMPTQVVTGTPGGSSQPTTGMSAGSISDCTTSADKARHMLDICGSKFDPGDKISLIVVNNSGQGEPYNAGKVNASGAFVARLDFSTCKDGPLSIYAKDITGKPPLDSNAL